MQPHQISVTIKWVIYAIQVTIKLNTVLELIIQYKVTTIQTRGNSIQKTQKRKAK